MTTQLPYLNIKMIRDNLEDFPVHEFTSAYRLRSYGEGDEETWLNIHRLAYAQDALDIETISYRHEFGHDEKELANRQLFIETAEGQAVGTTTAWFDAEGDRPGRIHWVAIVPEHRGKGLAKPMLSAAMTRLKELDHGRVLLGTQTTRIPAIALYLKFGFRPWIRNDEDRNHWRHLIGHVQGLDSLI